MSITIHPKPGQILLCDFSTGFKEPEMVKSRRPVIVLTGALRGRSSLVTVVPLSTLEPITSQPYHYQIPTKSLPMLDMFQSRSSWLKGDMVYTVGFHRLDLVLLGKRRQDGKRDYFKNRLSRDQMKKVYECVLHGLNLGQLGAHL
jgi:uncharacterized protein YifN (PemK superfamily)